MALVDGWGTFEPAELALWRDHYATRVALADEEITEGLPALTAEELRAYPPRTRASLVSRGLHLAIPAAVLREGTVAYYRAQVEEADKERSRRLRTAHLRVTTGMAQFPADWLADVKRRVNLDGVVERECGIALGRRSAGDVRRGPCPFCGASAASAAFAVYLRDPDREGFYCFRCGREGDAVALIGEVYRVPFRAAVEILAAHCGVALPPGMAEPAPPAQDRLLALARGRSDA